MISAGKQDNALRALHCVLITARAMSYLSEPGIDVAEVLDEAEYLVVLLMKSEDATLEFREHLESLAQKRERFSPALRFFDEL